MTTLFNYPAATGAVIKSPAIKDSIDTSNYGLIALPQACLQDIFKRSGPLATSAEFQVDYWNLVFRHTFPDNSIIDIAVPLVFFNYPQEVSGVRIDFEMKDVSAISDKLLPVANNLASAVLATEFPAALSSLFNLEFETLLVPLNTIHRHPGGSAHQSFSGTDLTQNPDKHGVVYPWKVAEPNTANFAGIMAIDKGICNLAHMEYRLVEGTLGVDIAYRQGGCVAYSYSMTSKSDAQAVLSTEPDLTIYEKGTTTISPAVASSLQHLYRKLFSVFTPMTDFVFEENITARKTSTFAWPDMTKSKPGTTQYIKYTKETLQTMDINILRATLRTTALAIADDIYTATELLEYTREQLIEELEIYYQTVENRSSKKEKEDFDFLTITQLEDMYLYDLRVYLNKLALFVANEQYPLVDTVKFTKADVISEIMTYYRDYHEKQVELPTQPAYQPSKKEKKRLKRMQYDTLRGWYTHKDI